MEDQYLHRNDVWWYNAPIPRRWHRCSWWSAAWFWRTFVCVQRCACGAIRLDGGPWTEKNSRRKDRNG